VVPTPRLALLFAVGGLLALAGLLWPAAILAWVAYNLLLAILAGVDRLRVPASKDLEATRSVDEVLSLSVAAPVRLTFAWHGDAPARLRFADTPPDAFTTRGHRGALHLPPRSRADATYTVVAHARGPASFGDLHLALFGPLGLVSVRHRRPLGGSVRVYPDVTALVRDEAALLAGLHAGGVRARRSHSDGREFDRLRDYVPGDDYRTVDWKATARRGRPITRQHRPEQNQDVLLLVDCGRHMRPRIGPYTRLDYAVNTAVTLAHVAIGRGDQVGLVVFGDKVHAYLPPRRGRDQLMRIVEALYPTRASLAESDYHAAYDALGRRALRRALVVTFTDVLDEETSRVLLQRTGALRPRHLPLVVTIRDSDLAAVATSRPADRQAAYARFTAGRVLRDQETTLKHLTAGGALVLNVPAKDLTAAAVSRYLEVKARGRL
jgi:uncharacterized protein (DUF58 family)